MDVIDTIPLKLAPKAVSARLRFNPARAGDMNLAELIARARTLIRLRAVHEIAFIGAKGEDTVEIAGVSFHSRILRENLDRAEKVFPFILTAGPALEAAASASGDLLVQYYLEEIANLALENAAAWLGEKLARRWGFSRLSSMDPGSLEDWPITEQPKLFSLFGDTERLLGVRLTDGMLMIPRKSISGIFFPSEAGFVSCQLCDRAACPGRKSTYDETLAAKRGLAAGSTKKS